MPDGKCTVTIDGSYSGEWIIPCDKVVSVEENTLINYSNSTIYLYKSLGNSYPRIALGFNQLPIYYGSNQISGITISNITDTKFNINSQFQKFNSISSLLISSILLFSCLTLLIRRNNL